MKICPVGSAGQTDRHNIANSRFSQICEGVCKAARPLLDTVLHICATLS